MKGEGESKREDERERKFRTDTGQSGDPVRISLRVYVCV